MKRCGVLIALTLLGCAPPTMPAKYFVDHTLAPKAAFDLQCPKDQLQYVDLGGEAAHGRYGYNGQTTVTVDDQIYLLDHDVSQQQGVSGCGRHASYTYVNGAWIGNGAGELPKPDR